MCSPLSGSSRHAGFCVPWPFILVVGIVVLTLLQDVAALDDVYLASLRQETAHLFYHGFDNYMRHAFPEDELRPVTCGPFTRDFENQNHWELNDPLPDFSLTLIDSLSTLAVLASSSEPAKDQKKALKRFQDGVQNLIELYGDGSEGESGVGERGHGFDIDSKVQVFETVIRGLGGLLSAHLFAMGELPILGYDPVKLRVHPRNKAPGIRWSRTFTYNGQLLRLAHDLGRRLLPAFNTQTGIPYPRVNLRHGIPFYRNAARNCGTEKPRYDFAFNSQCPAIPLAEDERTETCSAGAGSLVLEFTTLSRLTGDDRFERLAKRAFWSIWDRRMPSGLVGAGIDAETGEWKGPPSTGIGAGIDSFYEYALKSYILLSGVGPLPSTFRNDTYDSYFEPPALSAVQDSAEGFLDAWQLSQQAINRHVYRGENAIHPHYTQVNLYNAAQQAAWIDSLSAFYPGVLTLAGHVEEAAVTHLLFAALWTRYSAIPERWSTTSGDIEHGLPWWPGRPEFIESTYYLYQATRDPWYLHVGEMALRDIKRRCWTACGLAGIQDVRTGELTDRMESFFLSETAKYLHLLFDPQHPLNKLDAPFVFTTEGHPLVIPKKTRNQIKGQKRLRPPQSSTNAPTCPASFSPLPLTISNTAARSDLFHAAALARLHLVPSPHRPDSALYAGSDSGPGIMLDDLRSPTNYTFYPWTLPEQFVPPKGVCAPIPETPTFHITFPTPTSLTVNAPNHRTMKGIMMNNLAGVRLSMIQDFPSIYDGMDSFRVHAINNNPIGRDEQMYIARDTFNTVVNDDEPMFSRVRDSTILEIVFDLPDSKASHSSSVATSNTSMPNGQAEVFAQKIMEVRPEEQGALLEVLLQQGNNAEGALASAFRFIADKVSAKLSPAPSPTPDLPTVRHYLGAITSFGPGAAPLPSVPDAPPHDFHSGKPTGDLVWKKIYAAGQLCERALPTEVPRKNQVVIVQRGECSYSTKLGNIPSYAPSSESLQLVILVDDQTQEKPSMGFHDHMSPNNIYRFGSRPALEEQQRTPSGLLRRHPIPLVMVEGGKQAYDNLSQATALGVKRKYTVQAQGVPITNVHIL